MKKKSKQTAPTVAQAWSKEDHGCPKFGRVKRKYTQNVAAVRPRLAPWINPKLLAQWLKGERAKTLGILVHEIGAKRTVIGLHDSRCLTTVTGDDDHCQCDQIVLVCGAQA